MTTTLARTPSAGSDRATGGWHALTSRPILRRAALAMAAAAMIALDAHFIGPYVARAAAVATNPVMYWVAIAFAAEIVSILATAFLQRRMLLATGTQVAKPTAIGIAYAAYAVNMSVPAGSAVAAGYTFRRLRDLGASSPAAGFTLISSGVLNALSYGLVAVAGFTLAGGSASGPGAIVVGVLAAVLLVFGTRSLFSRPEILERVGLWALRVINRVRRRDPYAGTTELRRSTSMLTSIRPRGRDWAAGMTAALINWAGDLGCLFAACQAMGANGATIGVVTLAYLAGTSVSGISLVPGGLGVVDAALIVILVHNGVGVAPATAAVFLYRALSFGFGVVVGWSAWIGHARIATHRSSTATPSIWRHHDHNRTPRTTSHEPFGRRSPGTTASASDAECNGSFDPRACRDSKPHPGHVRLPGRSRPLADRGRLTSTVRRRRVASPVRRERIRSRTRRHAFPGRAGVPSRASTARLNPTRAAER